MNEAYFHQISRILINLINESKVSIDVAMAWFTNSDICDALKDALYRGVKIRLILLDSPINFMEYAPDFNELIQHGGQVYIATIAVGFMHHKFCLIDHEVLVSGSYNWTYYAETRNLENIFICSDTQIIQDYQEEFEKLVKSINIATTVPRYTLREIEEQYDDVNFKEINTEIEHICNTQNRPIQRAFETKTQVIIKETVRKPISKWHIGIMDDKNKISKFRFIRDFA
jgi:phosphatidylserine/phosphatidylglycerophosphate/cardiolipin synthase-like enzyme